MEKIYVRKEGVLTQPGRVDSRDSKMASIILLEGEEAPESQTRGAAKLDTDVEFHL